MATPYLFQLPDSDKADLFEAAEQKTRWPAYVLEKDYHVTLVLKLLFEDLKPQHQQHTETPFLFKGGTTLSKVFDCIERMSEDIDLSLDRSFLHHPDPDEAESNNQFRKRLEQLEKSARETLRSTIKPFLDHHLRDLHSEFTVEIINAGMDLEIHYPRALPKNVYATKYIKPRVLVECGGRAGFEPHDRHLIQPASLAALGIDEDTCHVDVLGSDRTFFEKLTAVHEINNRGTAAVTDRQSRHLYDLTALHRAFPDHIHDRELLAKVVEHKQRYFRRATANWAEACPGSLRIVPEGGVADQLRKDWEQMGDMFPGGLPCTFDELLQRSEEIDQIVNRL